MKTYSLFPCQFRAPGWILALAGFVLVYFISYRDHWSPGSGMAIGAYSPFFHGPVFQNLMNTLAFEPVIIGLFLIAFSKKKIENELIARMREYARENAKGELAV